MSIITTPEKQKLSKTTIFALAAVILTILSSAIVIMWAIIANPPGDTVGKAFLTIFIVAAFSFGLIAEHRVERSAVYVIPGRISALILIALSGLYMTWNQVFPQPWVDFYKADIWGWFGVIFLLEGVVATIILFWPRMVKNMKIPLVRYAFDAGVGLTIVVAVLIAIAWTTWDFSWSEVFWRIILAFTVLALVLFALPLVISIILAPKKPRVNYAPYQAHDAVPGARQPVVESAPTWESIVARDSGTTPTPPLDVN